MPYLVKDREHMRKIEAAVVWPTLAPAAEEQGYKMLAVWENGFRHITNNKRPIVTPEDLSGIKLRTPSGEWRVKMFQAYGANPTPMSFSEVFTALQTGVVDGQENPLTQIASGKFQEVQDYLSMTGHVYTPAYLLVGLNRWNGLPEDVRQILEETAKETQAFVYESAERLEGELLAQMQEESDIQVNEADKDAFIAASDAIYKEFGTQVEGGAGMIEKAISLGKSQ
jgi:tripartite ATP-independent transporter DctP family solute receptor